MSIEDFTLNLSRLKNKVRTCIIRKFTLKTYPELLFLSKISKKDLQNCEKNSSILSILSKKLKLRLIGIFFFFSFALMWDIFER